MNTMNGPVVGCEIELRNGQLCAIPPIDRCATCGRAFCRTHQAMDLDKYYTDQCAPCLAIKQDEERKRDIEENAPRSFFNLDTARDTLRKSGVQLVKCYEVQSWIKKGFLTSKKQEKAALYSHGWVLGTFTWIVSKYLGTFGVYEERRGTYESHTEECMTALLDIQYSDSRLPSHIRGSFGLVPVRPYADEYEILCLGDNGHNVDLFVGAVGASTNDAGWHRERWVQARRIVRKLAGVPDDV